MRNLKRFLFVLFVVLSVGHLVSAQGSMRLNKNKQKINFKLVNNLIVIPVEINGKSLSFILDTGASKTILFGVTKIDSLTLLNQTKVKLHGIGSGAAIEGVLSKNNRINCKGVLGFNQSIYIIPEGNFDMASKMGRTIHGVIGYEFFKNFVVSIDYRRKYITLYEPQDFNAPRSKKYKVFDMPLIQQKPYLLTESTLLDNSHHKTRLLIDSGNSDALWLFHNKETGLEVKGKFFEDYLGESLSGSIKGKRTKLKTFSIGDFIFKEPTVAFLDSTATLNAGSKKYRHGSIGSLILQRFNTIFDYPNKKLYLKKTKSFNKDFRFNRAGIELAYAGKTIVKTEKIHSKSYSEQEASITFELVSKYKLEPLYIIQRIRQGSVAEKAGLRKNDILQSINGKQAYDYNYNNMIGLFYGDVGSHISIKVLRNGLEHQFYFTLKKLL